MLGGENLPECCLDIPPSLMWKNTYLRKKLNGILACQIFQSWILRARLQLKSNISSVFLLFLTTCSWAVILIGLGSWASSKSMPKFLLSAHAKLSFCLQCIDIHRVYVTIYKNYWENQKRKDICLIFPASSSLWSLTQGTSTIFIYLPL